MSDATPETCPECGHPFAPHILLPLDDEITHGVMYCPVGMDPRTPEPECPCYMTWRRSDYPEPADFTIYPTREEHTDG